MDAKMIALDIDRYRVIEEFWAHMIGVLKEWYCSLGPIRQDELHKIDSIDTVIVALYHEFLEVRVLSTKRLGRNILI